MVGGETRFVPSFPTRGSGDLVKEVERMAVICHLFADTLTVNLAEEGLLHPWTGDGRAGGCVGGPVRVLGRRGTSTHIGLPPDTLFGRGTTKIAAVVAGDEVERRSCGGARSRNQHGTEWTDE